MGRKPKVDNVQAAIPEGGVMRVSMEGTPDQVREHLGVVTEDQPKNGDSAPEEKDIFTEALKNARNVVVVRRIKPRVWNDQKSNVEVYRESLPLSFESIQEDVFQAHGGQKFRVAIIDSETGELIAARVIENDADPIMPEAPQDDEDMRRMLMQGEPPAPQSAADVTLQSIEETAKMTAAQIQAEQLKQTLENLRGDKRNGKNIEDPRMRELEVKIVETQYQAQLSAVEAKHRSELDEVRRKLDAIMSTPPPPQNKNDDMLMRLLMEQMKSSNEKFERLMEQMNNQQLTSIQQQLREIKNAPKNEGSTLKDSISVLKDVANMLGMEMPGAKDDDEESDEGKEWYEVLIEKHIPRIFDLIEDKKSKGETVTKEQLVQQFNDAADQAAAEAVARIKQTPRPLPPAPTAPPSPIVINDGKNVELYRDKPPMVTPQEPMVPMPAPKLTPEQEIAARCNGIMETINREALMRPRDAEWAFVTWGVAPEPILEKMATAPDVVSMFGAFDGILLPEALALFKAKVAADPKVLAWLSRGHNELKLWWKKAQLDPEFDPADDGEDDVEVEGT